MLVVKLNPFVMHQANMLERYRLPLVQQRARQKLDKHKHRHTFSENKKKRFVPLKQTLRHRWQMQKRRKPFERRGTSLFDLIHYGRGWRWSPTMRQWIVETLSAPVFKDYLHADVMTFANDNDFFVFRLTYPQTVRLLWV